MPNFDLRAMVDEKSEPRYISTFEELRDYYQDELHLGEREWIGRIAADLLGTTDRSRKNKEYGAARRSLERYNTGESKQLRKYGPAIRELGAALPPIGYLPNRGGYEVHFTIKVVFSGSCDNPTDVEERTSSVAFVGRAAIEFFYNPTLQMILDAYMEVEQFDEENPAQLCEVLDLIVTELESDEDVWQEEFEEDEEEYEYA